MDFNYYWGETEEELRVRLPSLQGTGLDCNLSTNFSYNNKDTEILVNYFVSSTRGLFGVTHNVTLYGLKQSSQQFDEYFNMYMELIKNSYGENYGSLRSEHENGYTIEYFWTQDDLITTQLSYLVNEDARLILIQASWSELQYGETYTRFSTS